MAGQILVPFNSNLRIEDTFSAIKETAKPGMTVVFLFRYPVNRWTWFRDHWVTTASLDTATRAGRTITERYSWAEQRALAEERVAPWRYALEKIGVSAAVDVYAGSLSSVVEKYRPGDETSVLIQAQNRFPMMCFLPRSIACFGSLKRAGFRPVLSVRSGH